MPHSLNNIRDPDDAVALPASIRDGRLRYGHSKSGEAAALRSRRSRLLYTGTSLDIDNLKLAHPRRDRTE
jgi:hypothetical protein